MRTLNEVNGADKICDRYERKVMEEFTEPLIGVMMGIAYGGDVERLATTWKDKGTVYGFDVFEAGHPRHLSFDKTHFEATCMDLWYEKYGMDELSYEFQRKQLDDLGLTNAILVRGEVSPQSCNTMEKIHYAFLDMDIYASMNNGYNAVKDKIVPGGYLLLHDVENINTLTPWYKELRNDWEVLEEFPSLLGILRKPK